MDKEQRRLLIQTDIAAGISHDVIAEKYSVAISTVKYWADKLQTASKEEVIAELVDETEEALELIRQQAIEVSPKLSENITKVIDGVKGLKTLDEDFKEAMQSAVKFAQEYLQRKDEDGKSILSLKEWQMITSTLSTAYGQIFNKAGTTINVAQTNMHSSNEQLTFFKSSQQI